MPESVSAGRMLLARHSRCSLCFKSTVATRATARRPPAEPTCTNRPLITLPFVGAAVPPGRSPLGAACASHSAFGDHEALEVGVECGDPAILDQHATAALLGDAVPRGLQQLRLWRNHVFDHDPLGVEHAVPDAIGPQRPRVSRKCSKCSKCTNGHVPIRPRGGGGGESARESESDRGSTSCNVCTSGKRHGRESESENTSPPNTHINRRKRTPQATGS